MILHSFHLCEGIFYLLTWMEGGRLLLIFDGEDSSTLGVSLLISYTSMLAVNKIVSLKY